MGLACMPKLRLLCWFIDRLRFEEDCPDKWEGSICFAVAFIRCRILCRLSCAPGGKPGQARASGFLRAQLSAKLAATYATICFRDGQLRCADGTKAFYDLIIPATLDPQSRMTTT